ncbi:unnamed protein product (macronuclear) [Paramecium tetraurelia]|uniref:Protein kinase domain-containing protein n=1 Tax=Paramecium tetraurelia TaxID=5888 RepID=A0CT90_PARTE|nr:uncharacterized protein GSPATT00010241001 [Paramecium tetraurelia]CAK74007.1 unnamed protein product [Paramecium tetraurelia]|eukprot:XP_001441404.1 hypothetical protein (macronuclear) [Paramecium tetraurelia strain d4-2]
MNQVLPILPSQINNTILKRMPNNELLLEYQIQQNTDCKDAFEWDLNASQIHQTALAQIVSVDFRIGTITLSYEKQQLLNAAIRNNNQLNQLYILFQLLETCYELHKRFLLGRCLSTSAIEIDPNSKIKIYRYGFSHNLMNKDELIQLAPETIFEDKVQISSDIWLIGMILYELTFKKPISQFKYPDQLSQYKNFIRTSMQNNTFENLYSNFVDPKISVILQLLLIFDAEARVESYQAVILNLKDLLPQHKAKLDEILRFYENDITHISIKINSKSEQRDPPNRTRQKNVKSKSLDKKQIYYENLLHASRRIINKKELKYAYTQNVQQIESIYKLQIVHKENQIQQNINLCQNVNFQLYQISFLINLRQLIASLTNGTELMILDKYLFVKIEQIIDLLINNIKNIKSILFTSELNHIQNLLGQIKNNYSDISKISDRLPAKFLKTTLQNQIQQFLQVLQNNNLTQKIAAQISLRLLIAQNIEYYLADKQSVNLFFFPMKFYLGLSEITEPQEIERYLQRSTISQQIYLQNLLMKYKQQQQIQ